MFSAIEFKPKHVFCAFENVNFCFVKEFDLLISNPPLLVGRQAADFGDYLEKTLGVQAAGIFTEISSPEDLDQTIDYMAHCPHGWSLVSAGVNADIIAPIMAKNMARSALITGMEWMF